MSEPHGPSALGGVRVISFGAFVAGNTAALLLAELGADVVKIEPRDRPEILRGAMFAIGETATEPSGVTNTVMYGALSRSVRSLSIDLARPEARPIFHRLVAAADIVVENFGGDTLTRWGCSFEDLLADNPRLVMLSLSGYGRSGPRQSYLAYASNICGYMGLTSAWGYSHGTLSDYVTGASGALAAVAGLRSARATKRPLYLDVSQIEAMAPLLASVYLGPLASGASEPWVPNGVPGAWLAGVFRARGDDAWLAVELEDAADWNTLCAVLGLAELAVDAGTPPGAAPTETLRSALAAWAASHTAHTAAHLLQKHGLAAGAVQDSEDIWRDPQLRERGVMQPVAQHDLGVVTYPRSAARLSVTPGAIRRPPPRLGEHSAEVLREWLDLGDGVLNELVVSGAVFEAPAESGAGVPN